MVCRSQALCLPEIDTKFAFKMSPDFLIPSRRIQFVQVSFLHWNTDSDNSTSGTTNMVELPAIFRRLILGNAPVVISLPAMYTTNVSQ